MRIVVVSASASKTSSEIPSSFVYDEGTSVAKHGIEVHVVRNEVISFLDVCSFCCEGYIGCRCTT